MICSSNSTAPRRAIIEGIKLTQLSLTTFKYGIECLRLWKSTSHHGWLLSLSRGISRAGIATGEGNLFPKCIRGKSHEIAFYHSRKLRGCILWVSHPVNVALPFWPYGWLLWGWMDGTLTWSDAIPRQTFSLQSWYSGSLLQWHPREPLKSVTVREWLILCHCNQLNFIIQIGKFGNQRSVTKWPYTVSL